MKRCHICKKKIWFWQDSITNDNDELQNYHTRCVLWNNRRGVRETYTVTHCHTQLKDGTMCPHIPIYTMLTLPVCEYCFQEQIQDFNDYPSWQKQLKEFGDKSSK